MTKSVVAISKGTDAEKMVEEAIAKLGGITSIIREGSVVVVKPNTIIGFPPEAAVNTSPEVVSAAIKAIRKAKPKEIILAEGDRSVKGFRAFERSGQKKAALDAGVDRLINICDDKDLINVAIRDAGSDIKSIPLPRFLMEADHLVSLPIFKTHVSMTFTCAMKNIKGVVQGDMQHKMHRTDLAASMLDLWSVAKADFSIVDLIRPSEGYGPLCGMPTDFGCIVAGQDALAVDATCCRMVGLDLKKIPYFEQAQERGFGKWKEKDIEVRGKSIKEVFKQLWIPYLDGFDMFPEYNVISDGACALCEGLVSYSLARIKPLGQYEKNAGMTIIMGKNVKPPKGVKPKDLIVMGDCAKKHADKGIFVWGCPPLEMYPASQIMTRKSDKEGVVGNYMEEMASLKEYLKNTRGKS
jgi:uncharacterized protein (DUF362 family)